VSLDATKKILSNTSMNILEKEDEAIWFLGDRVFKFSIDEDFIADRIKRLQFLPDDIFPQIIGHRKNMYVYKRVDGKIFGRVIDRKLVNELLDEIKCELWDERAEGDRERTTRASLDTFYRKKTIGRVQKFLADHEMVDKKEYINGCLSLPVMDAIGNIDWESIVSKAIISRYHGDFHNENILFDGADFTLLDWRQNFGDSNELEFGDAYYDLAKFYHGLIVSHSEVAKGNFSVSWSDGARIDISRPLVLVEAEKDFISWLEKHEFDVKHVKLLTALIFLNIAPLHEREYGKFLFYLGRYLLSQCQN
jgi:hypothetical protein